MAREVTEGSLLWEPSKKLKENSNMTRYMRWLTKDKELSFEDYDEI